MADTASLALLKGNNKTSIGDAIDDGETLVKKVAPAEAETIEFDPTTASTEDIAKLVKEYEIEVPADWAKKTLKSKRKWLEEKFGEDGEETTEALVQAEHAAEQALAAAAAAEAAAEAGEEDAPLSLQEPIPTGTASPPPTKAQKPPKATPEKAKGTAVAKPGKTGKIEQKGDDLLADLVHEIENLDQKTARSQVVTLTDENEQTLFKLGGILSLIQANNWFDPYASFKEYCESEVGLHYRKATYWTAIYNALVEAGISWSSVAGIGWSKLKEIAGVISQENVDEWVALAKNQTVIQLIETVKQHKQQGDQPQLTGPESVVVTKTFKLHADQKENVEAALSKAKSDGGTAVDTVALEYICLDFLGGQSLIERLKKVGPQTAAEAFEKAFPGIEFEIALPELEGAEGGE